jgi:MHS family proline/betaine transporter-like MFS transporter
MEKRKFVFFAATVGNVLEYYDFTIFTVFTVIIGRVFFSQQSEFSQILSALAVFSMGFVTRPIGGIIFGFIADRFGRRISLIISMLGMTIPTLIIGLIPGYDMIGIYAPIILTAMRLLQGLCISGEGTGTAIFVLEHYKSLRPGFITGLVHSSNIGGTILASSVGMLIGYYLPGISWAWRLAFILGGVLGIVGFYLRLQVSESPEFTQIQIQKKILKSPLKNVFQTACPSMIITFMIAGLASCIIYFIKGYLNIFMQTVHHLSVQESLLYFTFTNIMVMISMPIGGALTDRYGKEKTIKIIVILIILLILPLMYMLSQNNIIFIYCALLLIGFLAGCLAACAYIFSISLFSAEQRVTGVALSYNSGVALFGGTTPVISNLIYKYTNIPYSPSYYIMLLAMVCIFILLFFKNYISKNLQK